MLISVHSLSAPRGEASNKGELRTMLLNTVIKSNFLFYIVFS